MPRGLNGVLYAAANAAKLDANDLYTSTRKFPRPKVDKLRSHAYYKIQPVDIQGDEYAHV